MGKKIIFTSSSTWVGSEVETDITDWFENSACETLAEFISQNNEEIHQQAIEDQGVEFSVNETE